MSKPQQLSLSRPRALALAPRSLVCALALTLVLAPARAAPPMPTLFEELGPELNLLGAGLQDRAPAWFDVNLDGVPDPIWAGREEIVYLGFSESGAPELRPVSVNPDRLKPGSRATLSLVPIDVDDDGVQDLFLTGAEHTLFRVQSPEQLQEDEFPFPSIPGVTIFDVAVADFNADGLPDIALAMAVIASERLVRRGYPDLLLMNIGSGRFETHVIEPAREGFSDGLTVADMDGDRRPDLIESINYSHNVGASRVLLNRTPPGAQVPVFEPSEHPFDTGTHGMGACAADFDQDGVMDIYNTSVGLDQLSMGKVDGSYDDQSFGRGLFHMWGDLGMRSQWSPSFEDMNLDGRLDILVRQGGFGAVFALDLTGPGVSETGQDLLYLQREDGSIIRDFPPYTPIPGSTGRHAVIGDINDDGRPDVSLGGGRGSSNFWLNKTPIPQGGRALTVRLNPTISAWPATGVWVQGVCGGVALKRTSTSGGKMGGQASFDLYFAWPECDGDVAFTVGWPSGATTEHVAKAGATLAELGEPLWWTGSDELPNHVHVSPGGVAAEEICVRVSPGTPWECCAEMVDGCHIALSEDLETRAIARVDQAEPVALMDRGSRWRLMASPSPPIPGEEAELYLLHVGDSERFLDHEPSLFFGDPLTYAVASEIDEAHQSKTLTVTVEPDATELPVSLFCPEGCDNTVSQYPQVTWTLDVAGSLDPRWIRADTYPYQVLGGETEFWDWTGYVLARQGIKQQQFSAHTRVVRPDGSEVEYTATQTPMSLARTRISVSRSELEGVEALTVLDALSGYSVELPVLAPVDLSEAVSRIAQVGEGLLWHRLVANGDLGSIYIELKDDQGHTLSPALGLVHIEAEGADVILQPVLRSGAYDLLAMVRTTDCVESGGVVRVIAEDGRQLSSHPFTCRPEGLPEIEMSLSWAEIRVAEEPIGGATHTVRIHAVNPHNEVLGADAKPELLVTGGVPVNPKRLRADGDLDLDVIAEPGQHTLKIEVYANDQLLDTLSFDVDIPLPSPSDVPQSMSDAETGGPGTPGDIFESPDAAPPVASSSGRSGGCAGGGSFESSLWLLGLLLALQRRVYGRLD
jgi:hypothetical protein